MTYTSRPSSPPPCVCIKIKAIDEEKSKYKLHADSSFSPLIINKNLKMGEMSCDYCPMNNHILYQQNYNPNSYDMSSGFVFNIHTISRCEYSSTLKDMDGDVGKGDGDVSTGYGFLIIQDLYQCED